MATKKKDAEEKAVAAAEEKAAMAAEGALTEKAGTNKAEKNAGKKTARSAAKRKNEKKKITEEERHAHVSEKINELSEKGKVQGCLTYTEIMNTMGECDMTADEMDKM